MGEGMEGLKNCTSNKNQQPENNISVFRLLVDFLG